MGGIASSFWIRNQGAAALDVSPAPTKSGYLASDFSGGWQRDGNEPQSNSSKS
jgi:hypothetical protein